MNEKGKKINAEIRIKNLTKKGDLAVKPSINVEVNKEGNEYYDDIEELCAGERQRCDLAFLFGVNDMVGSDIILLDECFNHLDNDIKMEILNYMHDLTRE